MLSLWMLLLSVQSSICLIHVYHVCTISRLQHTPFQFSMSYPCLTSPSPDCTVQRGQCMKLSSVSEPNFFSNLHTNCLFPFFFSDLFIPLLFIFFIPAFLRRPLPLPAALSLYSSSSITITSLHPSHPVFSLFYSNSVSFHRVLSCSRTRCSRMSSWC